MRRRRSCSACTIEPRSLIAHVAKVTAWREWRRRLHSILADARQQGAIFNAWCDRMPVSVARRNRTVRRDEAPAPVSTVSTPRRDQGALILSYLKWTTSRPRPGGARGLMRAFFVSSGARRPDGTVYVNLDPICRRQSLAGTLARSRPCDSSIGCERTRGRLAWPGAARCLRRQDIVMPVGRTSRSLDAWNARVKLA